MSTTDCKTLSLGVIDNGGKAPKAKRYSVVHYTERQSDGVRFVQFTNFPTEAEAQAAVEAQR